MATNHTRPITLLAVDDEPQSLRFIERALNQEGVEVLTTTDPLRGLDIVREQVPPIVFLDLSMPKMSGLQLLEKIVQFDPTIEVILLTGDYSAQSAVEAIQKGASDYLTKPVSVENLQRRVAELLGEVRRHRHALELERELLNVHRFADIVGHSPAMLEVFSRIRRVAPHFRTLLITGPTGTGKELVARALHQMSPAAGGKFVTCNCSAIVETLIESELFGHVRGAFTGATKDQIGLFEYANNGTLFLDEIGDMPLATQAKLLRVLQTQEFQPVGSPVVRKVDVRVIAATHRDLPAMTAESTFRKDLYYRLSMVEIELPRLAERMEDLPLLVSHFVERFAALYNKLLQGLTRRAQNVLGRYSWPGNVRELENVIGNAAMMAQGERIDVLDLPERLRASMCSPGAQEEELDSLEEAGRRHVRKVLGAVNGNKAKAAEVLGISRATLYRLLSGEKADGGGKSKFSSAGQPA
jgi:DNA-binding NtrC family response regulator